jgi:hypothetical protein
MPCRLVRVVVDVVFDYSGLLKRLWYDGELVYWKAVAYVIVAEKVPNPLEYKTHPYAVRIHRRLLLAQKVVMLSFSSRTEHPRSQRMV